MDYGSFPLTRTHFSRLKAPVFWSERWENEDDSYSDLRVTSSRSAFKAYRTSVADPVWADHPIHCRAKSKTIGLITVACLGAGHA
jgi:hypothetical protein